MVSTGLAYMMLNKASPSTFCRINEGAMNLLNNFTSSIKDYNESQEISESPGLGL